MDVPTRWGLRRYVSLLAVADEAALTVWRIDEDMLIRLGSAQLPDESPAHQIVFAPAHALLASLHGSVAHLWRVAEETLQQLGSARGHTDRVTDALMASEGTQLVTAARDGTLRLWHMPD